MLHEVGRISLWAAAAAALIAWGNFIRVVTAPCDWGTHIFFLLGHFYSEQTKGRTAHTHTQTHTHTHTHIYIYIYIYIYTQNSVRAACSNVWVPLSAKFSVSVQIDLEAHPASFKMCTWPFRVGKAARDWCWPPYRHLAPWLRMGWSCTSIFPIYLHRHVPPSTSVAFATRVPRWRVVRSDFRKLIVNANKLVISAQQICHFNIKVMLKYN